MSYFRRFTLLLGVGFVCTFLCGVVDSKPPFYPDKQNLLLLRDDAGKETPVKTAQDWARRRAHILENMQLVMGPLPDAKTKVVSAVKVLEEKQEQGYVRRKITFAVAQDERVTAYVLIPTPPKGGQLPAVLCLHQTNGKAGARGPAGLADRPDLFYGVHLARRGYVTLSPDYPSFGEYDYDFKKSSFQSGSMKAIWNNIIAVDVLCAMPEVDPLRIGCIGHSLGGHNAMFTAAFDTRLKAVVSNCGFTSFPKYYGGKIKGWTSDRYMPRMDTVYELKVEKLPFDFPEVVAALAPRAFLASAPIGDHNFDVGGVKDCLAAARPVFALLNAKDKLEANYPNCKHEFPEDVRKTAYEFLDRWLK